ncbi:hypothetical protein POTOM_026316 [Populus tomentosa]|uniref:Uncharacterized protein n=1 Tax=Populus tomentosa TaxID=118781 RepID=A0A8X7ZQP9_POPTO|nr:hypothetical protein POTOM_026316 [Populus tomentosa]
MVKMKAIFYVLVMLEAINPWQECILDLQPRQRKDEFVHFDFLVTRTRCKNILLSLYAEQI